MKACKLYVMNGDRCEAASKALQFGANGITPYGGNWPFMYIEGDCICFGDCLEAFINSPLPEISFHDFMQLQPKKKNKWIECEVLKVEVDCRVCGTDITIRVPDTCTSCKAIANPLQERPTIKVKFKR